MDSSCNYLQGWQRCMHVQAAGAMPRWRCGGASHGEAGGRSSETSAVGYIVAVGKCLVVVCSSMRMFVMAGTRTDRFNKTLDHLQR